MPVTRTPLLFLLFSLLVIGTPHLQAETRQIQEGLEPLVALAMENNPEVKASAARWASCPPPGAAMCC